MPLPQQNVQAVQQQGIIDTNSAEYMDSIAFEAWQTKLKDVINVTDELQARCMVSRKLRYAEVDIEGEKKASRLAPDELYIPRHIIDTNIRREQSSYVQYVTQSPRAVILQDVQTPTNITAPLEHDVTTRLRFDGWQQSMYALIDGMQQNGYSVMEVVQDQTQPGELAHEFVQLGDFGFIMDTRDIQETELVSRAYYFTKTRLINMTRQEKDPFNTAQVQNIIDTPPTDNNASDDGLNANDKSLYKIYKVMFRIKGVVMVAWCQNERCDDWLRAPRPLFLGRRKPSQQPQQMMSGISPVSQGQSAQGPQQPQSEPAYETNYPYFIAPYLISENNTISQLKGRVFLDQDVQEASSSLLSSTCTAYRRSAGLYFSRDVTDPNDDIMMQKDVYFRTGALINSKVTQFQLTPPDASILGAINALETMNQNDTSQPNFAVNNRKDSRKTATEMNVASQQQSQLTTTQVVLFATFLKSMYTLMFTIIQTRVVAGLIPVDPTILPLYQRKYVVKPSGDTDVIERQQLVQAMTQAWPVIQNTPANVAFLSDLMSKMFPETGQRYVQIFQQAEQQKQQQAQQAQQQQMQQQQAMLQQAAEGIELLAKHREFFSDSGIVNAYPTIQITADKIKKMQEAAKHQASQQPQQQ